jgi:hypothetical protein
VVPQLPTKKSLKVKCCFAKNGISVDYLIFINIALIISSFGRETIENYSRMDLPKLAGSFLCFQTGSACTGTSDPELFEKWEVELELLQS